MPEVVTAGLKLTSGRILTTDYSDRRGRTADAEMAKGYAMVYREGGRHYMVDNRKMDDGTMLFDHTGWHS